MVKPIRKWRSAGIEKPFDYLFNDISSLAFGALSSIYGEVGETIISGVGNPVWRIVEKTHVGS